MGKKRRAWQGGEKGLRRGIYESGVEHVWGRLKREKNWRGEGTLGPLTRLRGRGEKRRRRGALRLREKKHCQILRIREILAESGIFWR